MRHTIGLQVLPLALLLLCYTICCALAAAAAAASITSLPPPVVSLVPSSLVTLVPTFTPDILSYQLIVNVDTPASATVTMELAFNNLYFIPDESGWETSNAQGWSVHNHQLTNLNVTDEVTYWQWTAPEGSISCDAAQNSYRLFVMMEHPDLPSSSSSSSSSDETKFKPTPSIWSTYYWTIIVPSCLSAPLDTTSLPPPLLNVTTDDDDTQIYVGNSSSNSMNVYNIYTDGGEYITLVWSSCAGYWLSQAEKPMSALAQFHTSTSQTLSWSDFLPWFNSSVSTCQQRNMTYHLNVPLISVNTTVKNIVYRTIVINSYSPECLKNNNNNNNNNNNKQKGNNHHLFPLTKFPAAATSLVSSSNNSSSSSSSSSSSVCPNTPPPVPEPLHPSDPSSTGLSQSAIALIIIAGLVVVGGIIGFIAWRSCRRHRGSYEHTDDPLLG